MKTLDNIDKAAARKITRARTALLLDNPFFGTVLLQLKAGQTKDIPTAATDGEHLFYNPDFIKAMSDNHLRAVLAHEILHITLLHHTRRGNRDPRAWNIAADFAVNPALQKSGFKLPAGALIDSDLFGLTAEEIYKRLPKSTQSTPGQGKSGQGNQGQENNQGQDPGKMGGIMDAPAEGQSEGQGQGQGLTEAARAQAEEKAKIMIQQAAQAARAAGTLPGGIERIVSDIVNPRVPWQDILWRLANSLVKDDYTWARPNRRHIHEGLYLPAMQSDTLERVVLAVDVSGSIDEDVFNQFSAEIGAILERFNLELSVIFVDTKVQAVREYRRDNLPIKLESVGGGGTDFRPPFKYVEKNGLNPALFIYFTDLECSSFPRAVPEYPVIWAIYNPYLQSRGGADVPFGDIIEIIS